MAGNDTAGYDVVLEYTESAYSKLLAAVFGADGMAGRLWRRLTGQEAGAGLFLDVAISFDRDPGVALNPPDAQNPLDIRLSFLDSSRGGALAWLLADLHLVVGIVVDRDPNSPVDMVRIDFGSHLYFAQLTLRDSDLLLSVEVLQHLSDLLDLQLPNLRSPLDVRTVLSDLIPPVPVLPVPVDRSGADYLRPKQADFKLIDDTTAQDLDASAVMLTYKDGAAGDAAALRCFVPRDGGGRLQDGAIAVNWRFLCRMAVEPLAAGLGLEVQDFTITDSALTLNRTVRVDEEDEVDLTELELSLAAGAIAFKAQVAKSGFCYSATGGVSGELSMKVENGRLKVSSTINDPSVDVDIPWLCSLVVDIAGFLVSVLLWIATGILLPMAEWLARFIEGIVGRVADTVRDAIEGSMPDIDVPAFALNLLFQDVHIDDIVVGMKVAVQDQSPIRAEGTVRLASGCGVDLDTGRTGGPDFEDADVRWLGYGDERRLEAGCQAGMARTGLTSFDDLARYRFYGYSFEERGSVGVQELGMMLPSADVAEAGWPDDFGGAAGFGLSGGWDSLSEEGEVIAIGLVLAVRTNEGRFAAVQASQIREDGVVLRYRTYENVQPAVRIVGGFPYLPPDPPKPGAPAEFRPGFLAGVQRAKTGSRLAAATPMACLPEAGTLIIEAQCVEGTWLTETLQPQANQARLTAVCAALTGKIAAKWMVGGRLLREVSGALQVSGVQVDYEVSGTNLLLRVPPICSVELFVQVTVADEAGRTGSASRCVKHEGERPTMVEALITFAEHKALSGLSPEVIRRGRVTTNDLKADRKRVR